MHKSTPPLAAAEVCELLGITRSTLSRWVQAGRIEAEHKHPGLRGPYLFSRAEVDRVLTERAEASA